MEKKTSFSDMTAGEEGVIAGFAKTSPAYRKKLLAMGMTPGTAFKIVRKAPLGDPIEIQIRGYLISLRKQEADIIKVLKQTENITDGSAS